MICRFLAFTNRNGEKKRPIEPNLFLPPSLSLSCTYVDEFDEDASDGPDVDLRSVLRVSDQKLGSSVPAGRDVIGEVLAGC